MVQVTNSYSYPTGFSQEVMYSPVVDTQTERIKAAGLFAAVGLTELIAAQLVERSKEKHLLPWCPNDAAKRFSTVEKVAEWMQKGRLVVPPLSQDEQSLVGISWIGPGTPSETEPKIPGATHTFALRMYQPGVGKGLSADLTGAMLATNRYFNEANDGVWLETWGDNFAAIKSYERNGFREQDRVPNVRKAPGYKDTEVERVYMIHKPLAA